MIKAFLSHTSTDKDLVKLVQEKLSAVNAWYDAVDIENGQSIPEKINEGLRHSTHYVLFWGDKASRSPWVRAELSAAFVQMMANKCKFMIFVLDNTKLPELLQPYKYDSIDKSKLESMAQLIADKIMAQEGVVPKLNEFINRTQEIGEIEETIRAGYKLIILNGILGIGKSSLAEKAIQWLYTNRATSRIVLDFNSIPGLAELSLELSRLIKKPLKNENKTVDEQKENIRHCLEIISAANNILILKDVKKWLDEDGTFNQNLLFVTDLIVNTDMFSCVTFMTTSRYINVPFSYCETTRQLQIRGMDDSHIAEIIQNNLPKTFQPSYDKNLAFAKRLYGYPLGAKLGAYRISNHGYDYYLNQPQKIHELKVSLAKQLISYAGLSNECLEYLKILALCQSRLRNEEYSIAFPQMEYSIANLSDEAFFAGILKFDEDNCYKLELLVEDYFYDLAFNASNRKELCVTLETFLTKTLKNAPEEKYMRLVPVTVHILTLNGKIKEAFELRSELTATIVAGMWDQYNHTEYEEANQTAKELLAIDEENVEALYVKSLCLTRFDEYDDAEKILNELLKTDMGNSARYYYALGRIQKRQGNYSKAIELFQVAILKRRRYLSPYREMAECYVHMNKILDAQSAIDKAKQIDSSNIFVILLEARLLQKEGNAKGAIALLSEQAIIEQSPAQIWFRKGRAYDQLGMKAEAKECYREALKNNPKTYDAKLCLLNHQIIDEPEIAVADIDKLKSELRGKRKAILTNIEARFIGYKNQEEDRALELLESVPKRFIDKQWYAVKYQLLENLITKHSKAGRDLLAKEYTASLEDIKEILGQKYGEKTIVAADLLPDA